MQSDKKHTILVATTLLENASVKLVNVTGGNILDILHRY